MKLYILLALICTTQLVAQGLPETSLLTEDLRFRNIGPANMMGRIAAIEALDNDYRQVLVASASGGVFKSTNGGITWKSIFDNYGAGSIGAVARHQKDPDIIWVGTGESANRNSSGFGDGIYKSTDGGKTFQHMGLAETHQIAEIATHPEDPDIVYVAAIGHLWGLSGERGLYKTTDGGLSWSKLAGGLPDDVKTGCTEIIMHPTNPEVLFAGFYERLRQPASFYSGGPNGGLFKSIDGGKTWKKITRGLAQGDSGMIDVSIHLANPDIMVMAYEADENIPDTLAGSGVYRSEDGGESWTFLLKHAVRPFYHGQIEIDPLNPDNIYVVSRGFMVSNDGGQTFFEPRWRKDGGDEHDMWIAPYDSRIMYIATDQGARLTLDGGANFLSFNNMAIGQYYAIGVDMRDPYYVIGGLQDNGIWMGPSNSRERRGILNEHNTWVAEGDGFHSQIDPNDWRTVYTVNHVGFVARQNIETREHTYITPNPETVINFADYFDPDYDETPNRYTIDPGEHWFFGERIDRPALPAQFRFNWSAPFIISPNDSRTVYFGGNHLFRSTNRGDTWHIISPDLTTNDPTLRNTSHGGGLTNSNTGGENHFTIITIAESPVNHELIWVGTDDGLVHLSRDGGDTWENVTVNLPSADNPIWVSRVEASHFDEGVAYISLDNHRRDDNTPYLYKTSDYGQTWSPLSSNLPSAYPVYVIKEDPVKPGLLFTGTEYGVYTSLNDGAEWHPMTNNLPTVAIHDLVIHPRDGDLVVGTHGRSIYIMDDLSALRQINTGVEKSPIHLFKPRLATNWISINTGRKQPAFEFRGENPPEGGIINLHVSASNIDSIDLTICSLEGDSLYQRRLVVHQGINRTYWDLTRQPDSQDIVSYRKDLIECTTQLTNLVSRPDALSVLDSLGIALLAADNLKQLHKLRKDLVTTFGGYALGRPFFPKKIGPTKVKPGTYMISIDVAGYRASTTLDVRDDPQMR